MVTWFIVRVEDLSSFLMLYWPVEVTSLSFFSQNISGTGSPCSKTRQTERTTERENQCLLLMWAEWDTAVMDGRYLILHYCHHIRKTLVTRASICQMDVLMKCVVYIKQLLHQKHRRVTKQILTFLSKLNLLWMRKKHPYIENERTTSPETPPKVSNLSIHLKKKIEWFI